MKRIILFCCFVSICSVGFSQTDRADSVKPKKIKQKQSKFEQGENNVTVKHKDSAMAAPYGNKQKKKKKTIKKEAAKKD